MYISDQLIILWIEFMARQSAIQNIPLPVPPADIRKWLIEQKTKNLHKKLEKSSNWFQFDFCNQVHDRYIR